jgi:TRAP-type C4-dicarboxylate transport system permease small subunit
VSRPRRRSAGSRYSAALDRLYLASIWSAGLAILVMSLIIPWGVFTRYVLGTGSEWPEPIAILLMMVFTFVGAAAAYRAGSHIAVDMFTVRMPRALQRICIVAVDLLMATVCVFVVYYGARLCAETWHQSIAELPWLPVGVTYAPLPIGSAITLLFVIERMLLGPQGHRPVISIVDASGPDAEAAR